MPITCPIFKAFVNLVSLSLFDSAGIEMADGYGMPIDGYHHIPVDEFGNPIGSLEFEDYPYSHW